MSTDVPTERSGPVAGAAVTVAAPVPAAELEASPGVLGSIGRERAADYADAESTWGAERLAAARTVALERPGFVRALRPAAAGEDSSGRGASERGHELAFITEIKRASPSQGQIAPLDPVEAALAYEAGGASALSVLTEPRHFGGDLAHVPAVAGAVRMPILRKEFIVHPKQVVEAAANGASAVLLIVALLGDATERYVEMAHGLGLDALVEVHDDHELDVALASGARAIGVNNRDLRTLHIDLTTAPRLISTARAAGYEGVLVAESGYRAPADVAALRGVADAVLVGTSLAGSGDLTAALKRLRGAD